MQRIHDLSEAEVLELTDEQINKYIDVECVLGGIPLVPAEEPVEPDAVKPEPDQTIYKLGNFEFEDKNDAINVLEALIQTELIDRRYNSIDGETFYTISKPWQEPTITTEKAFSKLAWAKAEQEVKKYAAATAAYKTQKKEYDDAVKGREKVSEEVWTIVIEARRNHVARITLEREFSRYVDLADGVKSTAWKFFIQAHPEAEDHAGLEQKLVYDIGDEEEA